MTKPDETNIVEVLLYAQGFELDVSAAKKVVLLYKLSRESFSSQPHYDFGLRSIKVNFIG